VTGLNHQNDIEVAKVSASPDEFDLIPVSEDGVRAVSGHLGRDAEINAPVRVTDDQYQRFHEYLRQYVRDRGKRVSVGARRRFLGQKQVDQSDINLINDADLPNEIRERLSCNWTFLHLKDHNFRVLPVRYGPPASGKLYKVTKRSQTPRQSLNVSIGTLNYYRNTVDKHEASFTSNSPGATMRTMDGKVLARPEDVLSASISLNPCWIYCTTIVDGRGLGSEQSTWCGSDATPIVSSAEHFAYMLGAAFGIWSKPRLRDVYAYLECSAVLRATMNGIMVVHGAVRYMNTDDRNEYLESLRKQDSPLELHENVFTKSDEFAWEREYRFGVFGWGPPLQEHVILPLNKELMDCYGQSVPTESLVAATSTGTVPPVTQRRDDKLRDC